MGPWGGGGRGGHTVRVTATHLTCLCVGHYVSLRGVVASAVQGVSGGERGAGGRPHQPSVVAL